MACARQLGLVQLPIVCVNVDDYYEPFRAILDRAYEDKLIKLMPHEIVHFAPSAEEAVRWIEAEQEGGSNATGNPKIMRRSSVLKRSSFFSPPPMENAELRQQDSTEPSMASSSLWSRMGLTFMAGVVCGVALSYTRR
jgi:hypothetical protein